LLEIVLDAIGEQTRREVGRSPRRETDEPVGLIPLSRDADRPAVFYMVR